MSQLSIENPHQELHTEPAANSSVKLAESTSFPPRFQDWDLIKAKIIMGVLSITGSGSNVWEEPAANRQLVTDQPNEVVKLPI